MSSSSELLSRAARRNGFWVLRRVAEGVEGLAGVEVEAADRGDAEPGDRVALGEAAIVSAIGVGRMGEWMENVKSTPVQGCRFKEVKRCRGAEVKGGAVLGWAGFISG